MAGLAEGAALDNLAGDPASVDISAQGQWLPGAVPADAASPDKLAGTVTLRNASWKTDYLANHLQITQATLHMDNGQLSWDPVDFSYGPVKGTASVTMPASCPAIQRCVPQFQVQFANLDASDLEASFLGAQEPGTLLSKLIARLQPAQAPALPEMAGTVRAGSLAMGPLTLIEPSATLLIHPDRAEFSDLDAGLLGGHVHAAGTLRWSGTGQAKPAYTVAAHFEKLSPHAVGQLLAESWTGDALEADGKIDLSGFTDKDLTASAKGNLHFEWRRGAVEPGDKDSPAVLARFDDWTGDAAIDNGTITLEKNQVANGSRKGSVTGTLILGNPPKVRFVVPKDTRAARRLNSRKFQGSCETQALWGLLPNHR